MSADFQDTSTTESEPTTTLAAVPVWLILMAVLMVYWSAVYFDQHGGWFNAKVYGPYHSVEHVMLFQPSTGGTDLFGKGKALYHKPSCVSCHQASGQGTPGQFPSLLGSDWVLEKEPGRIIRLVLNGMQGGPIKINGEEFNFGATMVPWRDTFNDEEIAAVLTYVRREWGNKAPDVTPERVKQVREKTKDRTQSYTPDELMKVAPED